MRKKKIKILHVAQAAGGVDRYIRMLLKYLDKEKFENILVCSQDFNREDYDGLVDSFEQIEMNRAIGVSDLNSIKEVRRLIKKYNPDIVYAHSSKAGAIARVADIGLKNHCVYNPHGWAFNMRCSDKKRAMYTAIEKMAAPFCEKIICISDAEKQSALEKKICREDKLQVIFNGVDIEAYESGEHGTVKRSSLGIPEDAYVVGMVGRISPQKAPDVFVKMAKLVKDEIPNAHFVMLNAMEVREDDESFKNAVDLLFDALEQKDPDHFALRQYKKYKLAAGKTAKSILISCASRLAPFDIKEVREITMYDELDLDMLGDERTALFLIMSDTDGTFAFLISLIYSILFNRLCERADDVYGGRLPIHVRCLIDEAANIGQIPNLERLMATIRSREISACLVLQAQSQLKALYKDNMDTIIGNCDASLFLGGKEETTLKSWNSLLGKETIDLYNTSVTKGNQESHGQNFQKLGKDLMSVDELAVMDGGKCLLQIRGVRPFLSRKYDITKHPNYKLLSDFNEKNAFNIEKFLSTRMPMRPGERYRNYEVTAEDLASQTL